MEPRTGSPCAGRRGGPRAPRPASAPPVPGRPWDDAAFQLPSLFLLLQNMLLEMERKVASLAELAVHSESLALEGRAHTRRDAEQLAHKLHTLKGSLLELQRMLQDKQVTIQVGPAPRASSSSHLSRFLFTSCCLSSPQSISCSCSSQIFLT